MSDNLSQDDIDKLLNQNASKEEPSEELQKAAEEESSTSVAPESSNENPSSELEYLSSVEADTLGEIGNISMGSSATTLSMLLSNKVDITTPIVKEFTIIDDLFQETGEFITVEISYTTGLEGVSIFALKKEDSAIIADLMMGGSGDVGENPDVGELQLSAVGEAMNQMVGSSSTSMSSIFNFPIDISPPTVKLQESKEKLDVASDMIGVPIVAVVFKFTVGDLIDSEMIQAMSLDSAQTLVKTLTSSMQTAVDEMPVQKTPEQAPPTQTPPQQEIIQEQQPQPVPVAAGPSPQQQAPQQAQQNPVTVQPVQFASFDTTPQLNGESGKNLDLLMDIKLKLTVELGRSELPIKKVLELTRGSVIELDKVAGEPVELFANGKLIATGEVVVIEDNFGLRITNITSPDNRIKNI